MVRTFLFTAFRVGGILAEIALSRKRFLVERAGIPAAVILSPVDYEELEERFEVMEEEHDPIFQKSMRQARKDIEAGHYATLDDLKADTRIKERSRR